MMLAHRCNAAHAAPRLPAQRRQHHRLARQQLLCRAVGEDPAGAPQPEAPTSSSSSNGSPGASSVSSTSSGNSGLYGIMAALAAAGTAETAYLTINKLLDSTVACPTSGCDSVLSSPYAELFGLPLPLFGAATYAAVAVAALLSQQATSQGRKVPGWVSTGLAAGVAVLATTSSYLMYILQTQLGGAECVWCYGSAGLSAALLVALLAGMDRRQMAEAAGPGLGATAAAVLALYAGFGPGGGISAASELELPYVQPVVTTSSSQEAISLAARLRAAGAKMYGAFWCTHCYEQKQEFGAAAMADFPYVECFPEGWKKGVKIADACEAASVKAFPTWIIGGTTTEGQLDLPALEQLLEAATEAPAAAAAAAGNVAAAGQ